MRLALSLTFLTLLPLPALAWEHVEGETCNIEASFETADVTVTYFPRDRAYAIFLRNKIGPYPDDRSVLSIAFIGARPNTIRTRDFFFPDGDPSVVSVIDRGFGNVLDGLAYNDTAHLFLDDERILSIPLDGATEPVAAFRTCTAKVDI